MTIGEIPYGCNSAKFVEVVREMREALVSALETIERQEVEIVALQRRVENIDRQSASDGSDTAVAKTYSGFCAAFFASNRRNATEQEIFDAGVRAGIARVSPAIDTAGAKPFAYYTDWPGYRAYADEPHGWDEPGLQLTDPESIRDAWRPLVEPPARLTPSSDTAGVKVVGFLSAAAISQLAQGNRSRIEPTKNMLATQPVYLASPPAPSVADATGAKPVAWRWRLTAEINGKQWGPGPWEYTTHPEKFESRTLYEVEPLYTHPSAEIAALRERIAGMEKDAEIGHALIANGLYDRMNDMVDADEPRRLIEELIATVDPILYAKWAGRDARSSAEIAALRERITDLEAVEAMRDEEIAGLREKHGNALERIAGMEKDAKPCTCHPDDNPPIPCAKQYALSECRSVADGEKK